MKSVSDTAGGVMQLKVSAYHMVDSLATGLYESYGHCLNELVRNGVVACQPSLREWKMRGVKIEILLVEHHPLTGTPALVVLDHGCGLNDVALEKYCNWLGPSIEQLENGTAGTLNGAAQKVIGRFAALGLNKFCIVVDRRIRVKHGYHVFSRTSDSGNVRFVTIIPEKIEREGINLGRFVSPSSSELGPLRNIHGSFTAIVIPTPVFDSYDEIEEAIKWFLPREKDKMFDLYLGNRKIEPPELQSSINIPSKDGVFRARLGRGNVKDGGVWLCDAETGQRVASCRKMSEILPDPLWFPELVGDIFAPGLLAHQNTARSSLSKDYMKKSNPDWAKFMNFLLREVVPTAKDFIDKDALGGEDLETLSDVTKLFHECFGPPPKTPLTDPPGPRPPPTDEPKKPGSKRDRYVKIVVDGEVYSLYRGITLHEYTFAQIDPEGDRTVVMVNVKGGYKAMPKMKAAKFEHVLIQILLAIGRSKARGNDLDAVLFANETRAKMLRK